MSSDSDSDSDSDSQRIRIRTRIGLGPGAGSHLAPQSDREAYCSGGGICLGEEAASTSDGHGATMWIVCGDVLRTGILPHRARVHIPQGDSLRQTRNRRTHCNYASHRGNVTEWVTVIGAQRLPAIMKYTMDFRFGLKSFCRFPAVKM